MTVGGLGEMTVGGLGAVKVYWLSRVKQQFLSTNFPSHPPPPLHVILRHDRLCRAEGPAFRPSPEEATAVPYLTVPGFLLTILNRKSTRPEPVDTVQSSKAARALVHTERTVWWRYDHTRDAATGQEGKLWVE